MPSVFGKNLNHFAELRRAWTMSPAIGIAWIAPVFIIGTLIVVPPVLGSMGYPIAPKFRLAFEKPLPSKSTTFE